MQVDLPESTIAEAERLVAAGVGANAVDVINQAVKLLGADRAAIQEGIDAYERGEFRPLEEFGRDLRERYGVATPES